MLNAWLWQLVEGSPSSNRDSLDSFLYDYAFKKIKKLRSGEVYSVPSPSIFSGMELAVVRVRTSSLWRQGLTHGPLKIPPNTLPLPFTKRVDVVYQNLGNWSSHYYNVPNHTFVAPVLGFLSYDSNGNEAVEIRSKSDEPLMMDFKSYGGGGGTKRCVRFDRNGTLEMSSATREGWCVVKGQGHFSVVVPNEGRRHWEVWMGVVLGILGVFLVVLCVLMWKRKKMRGMEEETERSEELETVWVGRSRMPFASGIRTQPVLENSYLP
ncbi:hypothetical protein SASPL_102564 [Salvia splendens]|uniref:Uncharacterized protein n=2 Tax=Salvia splendens TaxID=180675 RepID=A0A8X8YXP5_SALSN|nr:hypothetical protein SASPL_102564 [Salvia splendens]